MKPLPIEPPLARSGDEAGAPAEELSVPAASPAVGAPPHLEVVPMTMGEAKAYITENHRHHKAPLGGLFAIGASNGEAIVGVVVVGRPVARLADNGWTVEVTRLASDGTHNVPSMLYRAAWRAARAMGYRKLITYTLQTEPGTSLRAAGFELVGEVTKRSWNTPSRPRVDKDERQARFRWELAS